MDISKRLVALAVGFGLAASGVAEPLSVDAQVYRSGATPRSAPETLKAPEAAAEGLKVELPPPVKPKDLAVGFTGIGPVKIGFGRDLPARLSGLIDTAALTWTATPDGGQAAVVIMTSPDAKALRAGITVYQLPDSAELRFFSPSNGASGVTPVAGSEVNRVVARDRTLRDGDAKDPLVYWSPVVEGATLGVEIYLPQGVAPSEVRIAVPQLSHLEVSPFSEMAAPLFGALTGEPCHQDVTCYWDRWGSISLAVARMIFTTDGGTSACTGTLLNDLDPNTTIPYFLTARHCISTQSVASSLQTFWFYQTKRCTQGLPDAGSLPAGIKVVSGGATLLDSLPGMDMTLLRLDGKPPEGAVMAGWDATPPAPGTGVTGIHHPAADLKKITFQTILGYGQCMDPALQNFYCSFTPSDTGYYALTRTESGFLEGGSSGSGLFRNDSQMLVGTLTGGQWEETDGNNQPNCGDTNFRNTYGRFDVAYHRSFNKWLAVPVRACELKPGDWTYCGDPACGPCTEGQGDCDAEDQCQAGLVCAKNVGPKYGFNAAGDVCERPAKFPVPGTCLKPVGDWEYCSDPACGPCGEGEGDCDSNSECGGDLSCVKNAGAGYGFTPALDVCGIAPVVACTATNGDWQYCASPGCAPCGIGKGDCDSEADCAAGLVCASDVGTKYGMPADMDVCEAPAGLTCTKKPGEWDYCSDTACGPCLAGQGDCDTDADCAAGLACRADDGEMFGMPNSMDVCIAPPPR